MSRRGVAPGTVITAVAGKPVADIGDLQVILNETPSEQCGFATADGGGVVLSDSR
jgi:S1-C subfamily serine protease